MNNRIMICGGDLRYGGAERVISTLANQFIQQGYDVTILLYKKNPIQFQLDPAIKVVVDEDIIGRAGLLRHITWRHSYFKEQKPGCIVSFLAVVNMVCLVANVGTGVPLIVADRSDPHHSPGNALLRALRNLLYRFAGGVVVQNERNQRYFSRQVQSKSAVIPNPVDVGAFRGAAAEGLLSSRKIIWAGRLMPVKNPMLMIDAMERVLTDRPDLELYMYGDGPLRSELESAVADRGLEKHIHIMGAVQDIYARMSESCLYVLTSDYEGMPNTLAEAMCVGLPVISTNVPGTDELIPSPKNGTVIPCGDVDALVSAMQHILSSPRDMLAQSAENDKLADRLNVSSVFNMWVKFIADTSKGK